MSVRMIVLIMLSVLSLGSKAACSLQSNDIYLMPGQSTLQIGSVSNLAFAMYFLEQKISGGGLIATFQALPGFFKDSRYGFTGQGATLYTSLSALPTASGKVANVTQRIYSVTGSTVCSSSFNVIIQ
ncbi:hypothetical protein [Gynuella sunshinyii]|uniref:Secreted protein n=1 Tax=Gynuella sunshinyii YC6258 TaxID=1445510 RepID=A0A0C5V9F1_9GAMM|nr:hypothetical protein [Gynuella sunshinyii]AJQ96000.1 hypothetical Protein YC6258_03964 [Gynuella sunshinyii YC6258]